MKMADLYPNFSKMVVEEQLTHIRSIRYNREAYFISKFTSKVKLTAKQKKFLSGLGILPENMEEALKLIESDMQNIEQ